MKVLTIFNLYFSKCIRILEFIYVIKLSFMYLFSSLRKLLEFITNCELIRVLMICNTFKNKNKQFLKY